MKVKIDLVFLDWQDGTFNSVYATPEGTQLSLSDFHHGTIFHAEIELDDEEEAKFLLDAVDRGYRPCFYVLQREGKQYDEQAG